MAKTQRKLKIHPLANMVPAMSTEAFAALKDDIAARGGLVEPIWIKGNEILDGRNRYRACLELGISPEVREYQGDDIEAFVISTAIMRRHMSAQQRAGLIKRLRALHPEKTNAQIAALVGVGKDTVRSVCESSQTASQPVDYPIPSFAGTNTTALRIGKDGKRYPATKTRKHPAPIHPGGSIVNPIDFEMKRVIRWIGDLDPRHLSDGRHFVYLLGQQLQRLTELLDESAAA